jgi:hypothetical protein
VRRQACLRPLAGSLHHRHCHRTTQHTYGVGRAQRGLVSHVLGGHRLDSFGLAGAGTHGTVNHNQGLENVQGILMVPLLLIALPPCCVLCSYPVGNSRERHPC